MVVTDFQDKRSFNHTCPEVTSTHTHTPKRHRPWQRIFQILHTHTEHCSPFPFLTRSTEFLLPLTFSSGNALREAQRKRGGERESPEAHREAEACPVVRYVFPPAVAAAVAAAAGAARQAVRKEGRRSRALIRLG